MVFSPFMLHHLEGTDREKTLRELRRILKPYGTFCLLDFEVSHDVPGSGLFSCCIQVSDCGTTPKTESSF